MALRVGLALGSNLGNRLNNIKVARNMLRGIVDPESLYLQAPIYQSQPVDCASDDPDFYNTVIEIDYIGEPYDLLRMTQGVEFHMGREAVHAYNAPRVIDVDILYFGSGVIKEEILTIPHPRILERRFVLQPLNDIRPHLILPGDTVTISEHYEHLDSDEPPLTLVQSVW
ncbi:2-amino-4-hydroxy-6-hydroxymethyldihydropteridine diphosphokinase [Rubritalea spongiae]|uniref:2-amino-4-hydroxy-6-hydroxymethyldihydropteridine pyrophosphokinase n=1 Tax=Rubritalea spongiae TaxID=430797 RepID=A0ABW5DYV5_9BACT